MSVPHRLVAVFRGVDARAFEIDLGKRADEARSDGVFVLRTNAWITLLQAVLPYLRICITAPSERPRRP